MISWQALSLRPEGSNLTLMEASTPSKESLAGTWTVGASREKSRVATGALALGSTLTGTFCPIFSILQL